MSEAAAIIAQEKAAAAKRLREKAQNYRNTVQQNRELAAQMIDRADRLEKDIAHFELAADSLELEVTGNW